MYVYTYEQKREGRDQGLGQTPPTPESREIALARALTNKYGVEFNSSRGQAVVVAKLLQDRYRPRSPQDPDQQKYDKTKIAAERIASPRPWSFDELRTVEYACDLYCRLGLLPIPIGKLNISRLATAVTPNVLGAPPDYWAQARGKIMGQTERPPSGSLEIAIFDSGMPERGSKLEKAATVIHELAHALLRDRLCQDFSMLPKHPWTFDIPPNDPVSEDIATSVCFFLIRPGELRKLSPPRYELLKKELRLSKSCLVKPG